MSRFFTARAQKNLSVYIGIGGYTAMVASGEFMVGVWTKLAAELLRIGFFREVKAPDMVGLSIFFICASLISIVREYFL